MPRNLTGRSARLAEAVVARPDKHGKHGGGPFGKHDQQAVQAVRADIASMRKVGAAAQLSGPTKAALRKLLSD